jgi:hypothetical protein
LLRSSARHAAAPVVLGRPPVALDQAIALETAQRGKEGAGIDPEHAAADLLEPHADAEPVHRIERQGLQNQHVQRALHQIAGLAVGHRSLLPGRAGASLV